MTRKLTCFESSRFWGGASENLVWKGGCERSGRSCFAFGWIKSNFQCGVGAIFQIQVKTLMMMIIIMMSMMTMTMTTMTMMRKRRCPGRPLPWEGSLADIPTILTFMMINSYTGCLKNDLTIMIMGTTMIISRLKPSWLLPFSMSKLLKRGMLIIMICFKQTVCAIVVSYGHDSWSVDQYPLIRKYWSI